MHDENVHLSREIIVERLDINIRLLLYSAGEIILYKSGNYHTTSDVELFLIWPMLEKELVNLPFIILKRMIYIAKCQTFPLPYGNVITHILKFLEIIVFVIKGDYILPTKANSATLKRIRYIKQGNEWRKKLETSPQRLIREARERRK